MNKNNDSKKRVIVGFIAVFMAVIMILGMIAPFFHGAQSVNNADRQPPVSTINIDKFDINGIK